MIETNCAACGKQLDYGAPKCVRCKSIYCDAACQHDHWRRGHKQMCKKIHRAGNAEQYHADKNYKEAVAEAVEVCADDSYSTVSPPTLSRPRSGILWCAGGPSTTSR